MKQIILLALAMISLALAGCKAPKVVTVSEKDYLTTVEFLKLFQRNGIEINYKESSISETNLYIVGKVTRTDLKFLISIPAPEDSEHLNLEHLIWTLPSETPMLLFTP